MSVADGPAMAGIPEVDEREGRRSAVARLRVSGLANIFGIAAFLLGVCVFFSVMTEGFLTYGNLVIILSNAMVIGIVALGQLFCIVSGTFDLSVSGIVPLGAVSYAMLSNHGMSTPEAMALVALIGAGVGIVNGLLTAKVGINPLIATFGMLSVTSGLALQITNGATVAIDDTHAGVLADVSFQSIPWGFWVLVGLAAASAVTLRYTTFGRSLYAIGGNAEASWLAGIRVDALRIAVYVICGGLAAFAGVILASELLAASGTIGADSALTSVAAVVLGGAAITGGTGSMLGAMAGVLVLGALANGMALMHVSSFYQQIVTGGVLLVAVGFGRLRALLAGE